MTLYARARSLASRILREVDNGSSNVHVPAVERQTFQPARTCQSTCLREQLMSSCPCGETGERRMPTGTCILNRVMILRRRENTSVDEEKKKKNRTFSLIDCQLSLEENKSLPSISPSVNQRRARGSDDKLLDSLSLSHVDDSW